MPQENTLNIFIGGAPTGRKERFAIKKKLMTLTKNESRNSAVYNSGPYGCHCHDY